MVYLDYWGFRYILHAAAKLEGSLYFFSLDGKGRRLISRVFLAFFSFWKEYLLARTLYHGFFLLVVGEVRLSMLRAA